MNKINLFLLTLKQRKKFLLIFFSICTTIVLFLFLFFKNQQLESKQLITNQNIVEKQQISQSISHLGQLLEQTNQEAETERTKLELNNANIASNSTTENSTGSSSIFMPTSTISIIPTITLTPTPNDVISDTDSMKVLPITIEDLSTPETIEKARQYDTLKSKCPIVATNFEIDFSYSDYMFNVFIVLDKKSEFQNWLAKNYPALEEKDFNLVFLP